MVLRAYHQGCYNASIKIAQMSFSCVTAREPLPQKTLLAAAQRLSYSSQKGVPYVERDVLRDERAMEELSELGYMTTPVIKVGDEVVVGFNRRRLEELLG